jgi:hypothetical protein
MHAMSGSTAAPLPVPKSFRLSAAQNAVLTSRGLNAPSKAEPPSRQPAFLDTTRQPSALVPGRQETRRSIAMPQPPHHPPHPPPPTSLSPTAAQCLSVASMFTNCFSDTNITSLEHLRGFATSTAHRIRIAFQDRTRCGDARTQSNITFPTMVGSVVSQR